MFTCGYNKYSQLDKNSNNENSDGTPIISPAVEFHSDSSNFSSFSTNFFQTVISMKGGKSYVSGDNSGGLISGSLPKKILKEDTEISLQDEGGQPCKIISVVCGFEYTLYLVSDKTGVTNFRLVYCYRNQTPNPLFLNIGNRKPRALFGGHLTSGVIDSDGGIIVITKSIFKSPRERIERTILPNGDKAVKLACCNEFVISLGQSGRVYESEITETSLPEFSEVKELSSKTVGDVSGTYDFCFAVLNDGRVFGRGNNSYCQLCLPKERNSVSEFTEIDSLNKYKIVSAFAGSFHSIFKTIENKMIVCGYNFSGQLFVPPKNIVYPPEEVEKFQGLNFCVVGHCVSAGFFGIEPPINICNKKIDNENPLTDKTKPKSRTGTETKTESLKKRISQPRMKPTTSENDINKENEELKKKLSTKETEIMTLKAENSQLKDEIQKLKKQNEKLERENIQLKKSTKNERPNKEDQHQHQHQRPLAIYTITEMNNFVEGKRIGRGATSEVIEVFRQEKLAKKVLNREISKRDKNDDDDEDEDEELKISIGQLKNLMKEYEVLNTLDHPNIIKTFGFFYGDSTHDPAILLEYCESNLKKRMKKLSDDKRISTIFSLSSAMKKVHEVGIIHRDLKPENILLDSNDNVKLSDFGLCTLIKNEDTKSRTQMVGSLIFMAPELLNGSKNYDEKVDAYAFGVVVFIILTKGKYPEISLGEIVTGKQAKIPSSISKFSSKLIKDCWSFKSSDRPSFAEICDRLKGNEKNLI